MLLQSCKFFRCPVNDYSNVNPPKSHLSIRKNSRKNSRIHSYFPFRCVSKLACLTTAVSDVTGIFQNKVLIAAALSAAIGQLSKPITSTIFSGKNFDVKAAIQAGGFPSTHSSAVVATATSLGLERGFSDAIFGLAVVYASLVMYDAQGVRREVGIHAKELNRVLLSTRKSSTSGKFTNSFPGESSSDLESADPLSLEEQSSLQTKQANGSVLLRSGNRKQSTTVRSSSVGSDVGGESVSVSYGSSTLKESVGHAEIEVVADVGEESVSVSYGSSTLKESVGHTEIEVVAGAVLGFIVSLAIC